MLKIIKTLFIASLCFLYSATAQAKEIKLFKDSFILENETFTFQKPPFKAGGTVYIEGDEFFSLLGYKTNTSHVGLTLTGDGKQSIIISDSKDHIIGYKMYSYKAPVIDNYIPLEVAEDISGIEITASADISYLFPFEMADACRLEQKTLEDCGNCYTLNRQYMFSPVTIHHKSAKDYAQILSSMAELLPDVNVYSMLIPDSYEIYAPKEFSTGQTHAFEIIKENVQNKVTVINTSETLAEHGEEKIFFSTDHHWTHRGAFYAWCEFAKEKGMTPINLESFENIPADSFSGSYIKRLDKSIKPKDILDNTTEVLDRFLPVYDTTATVYSSPDMEKMMGRVPLINTKNNTYSCFISGDNPLTVIESSIGNGKKLAIIKDSFGNALSTWAVNHYQYIYVIDIRGFAGGRLEIRDFYSKTNFDDLIVASYPTSIESKELRGYLKEMAH